MGAISLAIYVNLTLARILSVPNQWVPSRQLLMSTRTLIANSYLSIDAKPMRVILSAIDVNINTSY